MKGIFVLILAAAVGYVAYQYVYPPLAEAMKFEKHKPKKQEVAVVEAPKPKVAPPQPANVKPKPEPMPEAPKPAPVPAMPEAPKPEPPKPKEGEFVAPEFPPIDVVVQNWTAIPKSAFPRPVKMKKDLDLKMKIGNSSASTKIKAGGQIVAMSQDGLTLVVAPTETSPMRGKVNIDDTDLKQVLTDVYERWKVARLATLKRAHEFKLANAERAKNAPEAPAGAAASNDKPARNPDGTYPLLLASMKSGQVTEIKPDSIKEWGEPQLVDGKWTVIVKYETQTMFGKFDTEAQAQIKNGKVEKWVYTGSGEVVP